VRILAGRDEAAVGEDDVGRDEVVDREAVLAAEVAVAATQRESADTRRRHDPGRRGQTEGMRGVVEIAEHGTAPDGDERSFGIDPHAVHRREVDHEPAVDASEPAAAVAAAADGDVEPLAPAEVHRRDHVGGVAAARDQRRPLVDHRVVEPARVVVAVVGRREHRPAERRAQRLRALQDCGHEPSFSVSLSGSRSGVHGRIGRIA
jgi:hypothetical protein